MNIPTFLFMKLFCVLFLCQVLKLLDRERERETGGWTDGQQMGRWIDGQMVRWIDG
jgi:hypothetical protein